MSEFHAYTPDLSWEQSDDFPEQIGVRVLRHEPECGAQTLMLRVPPGAHIPAHCHRGTAQLFVLDGACERAGEVYRAGAYALLKGHVDVPTTASESGATLLLFLDSIPAHAES